MAEQRPLFGDAHPTPAWDVIVFADFEGTSGDDTINGTDGDDTIDGLAGNDMLKGGEGNDAIHGGTGNDYLNGNDGDDTLYGDAGNNEIHGGSGDDIIYAGSDTDLIYGGPGQNTIRGGTAKTTVYTELGNIDTIDRAGVWNVDYSMSTVGVSIFSHAKGGDYSTTFSDGSRCNYFDRCNFVLGSGADSFTVQLLNGFSVDAGAGLDNLELNIGNTQRARISLLTAGDGSIVLSTGYGTLPVSPNYINFETFVIDAGQRRGKISIDGAALFNGAHLDLTAYAATLDFSTTTQVVDFEVDSSNIGHVNGSTFHVFKYTVRLNDLGGRVTAAGYLYGGAGDDILTSTGLSYYSVLDGAAGDDTLTGSYRVDTMTGGTGNDVVSGGDADDKLTGDAGDDTIDGGTGNDAIDGGADNDTLNGSAGIDRLTGGLGTNVINGGDDNDTIVSAAGAIDTVDGGVGSDMWNGDYSGRPDALVLTWDGSLTVSDGTSVTNVEQVSLVLGGGDDHVAVTGASGNLLVVAAGAGSDVIDYTLAESAVTVSLAQSGLQNTGGGGSERIIGFENIIGSAYDDVLSGDGGANTLNGGGGADVLTGGGGADRFGFTSLSDLSTSSNINQLDRLTDFAHFEGDRIDLSAVDADPNTDGDQAFSFIGAKRFDVNGTGPGELRFSQSVDGYLLVQGDLNHDGKVDFSFLVHNTALVASDLVL